MRAVVTGELSRVFEEWSVLAGRDSHGCGLEEIYLIKKSVLGSLGAFFLRAFISRV